LAQAEWAVLEAPPQRAKTGPQEGLHPLEIIFQLLAGALALAD
jgi:hypothetical protein